MIAGVPGVGINGLFYVLLAAGMPLRESLRVLQGRSRLRTWGLILQVVAMAAGITVTLWGEYWLIEKALDAAVKKFPQHHGLLRAMEAASPHLSVAPFVVLAGVIGSVYLLRVLTWLGSGRLLANGPALQIVLIASLCAASTNGLSAPAAPFAPAAVYPPEGFDFTGAIPEIRGELGSMDEFYQTYFDAMAGTRVDKSYGLGLANQVLGILRNDPSYVARARTLFELQRNASADPRQRQMAEVGVHHADNLLNDEYAPAGAPWVVVPVDIVKEAPPTGPFTRIVLGRSAIHVKRGALVKTQVDRVTRDWAMARNPARVPWGFDVADHVPWHEGEKNLELVEAANAKIVPVWGTKVFKINGRWYAPDANGQPRFELSPDKVENYPSTFVLDDQTAIVNDTHGVSAIAWDSTDADLVVACGDHKGKMDAAYYLAERGVDVYAPTDRFMGLLIGAKTKGTIIGSAPIRKSTSGAVIGDQPVSIDANELIVVSNAPSRYPLQYYDTPKRYFDALAAYSGRALKIVPVDVKAYGESMNVVDQARKLGANVLGIRVKTIEEHDAVAAWLRDDPAHRAILFHTAVYPDGYKLYFEFPKQTSFGDIRPVFE